MPLVSIIIPTFDRAPLLADAIRSVLKQTFQDFELIIVDDGSTDETSLIVSQIAPRARYFYQSRQGVSAARNTGIRQAQGRYLAFLDSDDLWRKKKLEIQLAAIQQDASIQICYTNEIWLRNGQHLNQKKKHQKYSGWILEQLLPLCIISPSSVLIAREVLETVGLFDESLIVCEDYDLWLRIGVRYPIHFIDQPLIYKRGGHADQLSQQHWGIDRFRVQALEKLWHDPALKPAQRPAVLAMLQKKCQILAQGAHKRGHSDLARHYFTLAEKYAQ
ncbi:glycosyltransferase [candidate division KSB1 bacterium]|nr:glycosyltransferase [candidate division KSB1 bacterium]